MEKAENESGQPAAKDGYVECDQHALVRISYVAAFHSRGCPLCNMSELAADHIYERLLDGIEAACGMARERIKKLHAEADERMKARRAR